MPNAVPATPGPTKISLLVVVFVPSPEIAEI
jgi:hypothetical protein